MKNITDLDISTRAENALKKAGIVTLSGLKKRTKEELLELDGIGEKTAEELIKAAMGADEALSADESTSKEESNASLSIPGIEALIEAGIHFGHQHRRWHPAAEKYLFATEKGFDIFDLGQTLDCLKIAARFLYKEAANGSTFLFVGTKRQSRKIVRESAEKSEVYYITDRWIGGLLTNFSVVSKNWQKLTDLKEKRSEGFFQDLTKKEILMIDKQIERLDRLYGGLVGMERIPDVLVLSSARKSKTPIQEAKAVGVSTVAVVDSNFDPTLVDYPVPGNDDSRTSIQLLMQTLADAIILGRSA